MWLYLFSVANRGDVHNQELTAHGKNKSENDYYQEMMVATQRAGFSPDDPRRAFFKIFRT
jgi:hypothetical protein